MKGRSGQWKRAALAAAVLLLTAVLPVRARAQGAGQGGGGDGWDSERALELMELARERRLHPARDSLLRTYSARAEGFVYFYLDRRDTNERTLVKTDQVALELFWEAPNRTKQRIVGLRDESRLPNRMHYHLDHLTVVQNGFGDVIRMGDGDEVRDVPHPAAPGSDSIYEFRVADSLTLRLPTSPEPIRVQELQVRPRDTDRSALVGSVFVDRATGDLVRMTFTFTPASYVDRRIDYISVSLDNGLWEGRYWLPYEQTLQIRRQLPELDFAAGAVIHGRMRISDYVFNDSLPASTFLGYGVMAVPAAERESHDFEHGLYDDLNDAGLAPPRDLADVRREAAELLGAHRLTGLPRVRWGLRSVSSALRYNRAEGLAVGSGVSYTPDGPWRVDVEAGYAFGADRPWGVLRARRDLGGAGDAAFRLFHGESVDLGLRPAIPGVINTLSAAVLGRDYLDLYRRAGARLRLEREVGPNLRGEAEAAAERQRSAELTQERPPLGDSARFRPVRPIDEGDLSSIALGLMRTPAEGRARQWSGSMRLELGVIRGGEYLRSTGEATLRQTSEDRRHDLLLTMSGGVLTGAAPSQRLFLLGGVGTLPGYPYRSYVGTHHALGGLEASLGVLTPWVRLRLIGAAGMAGGLPPAPLEVPPPPPGDNPPPVPAWWSWGAGGSDGFRASVGAGVSVLWDLLRVDAVRGVNGGEWQVLISFHPEFRDIG